MSNSYEAPAAVSSNRSPFSLGALVAAAVVAAVANAVIFAISAASGAVMSVESPSYAEITLVMVIAASLVPLLVAGGVTWLIARRFPGFRRVAQWLGLAVAVASIASPIVATSNTATVVALAAMHLVSGAAWFVALARGARA